MHLCNINLSLFQVFSDLFVFYLQPFDLGKQNDDLQIFFAELVKQTVVFVGVYAALALIMLALLDINIECVVSLMKYCDILVFLDNVLFVFLHLQFNTLNMLIVAGYGLS